MGSVSPVLLEGVGRHAGEDGLGFEEEETFGVPSRTGCMPRPRLSLPRAELQLSPDRGSPERVAAPTSVEVNATSPYPYGDSCSFGRTATARRREHVVPLRQARTNDLTAREVEVLELMAEGWGYREIARSLSVADGSFISIESVKSIEQRVVSRLRAGSPAHAVAVGIRSGLIR